MTDAAERALRDRVLDKIVHTHWNNLEELVGLAVDAMKETDLLITDGQVYDVLEVDHRDGEKAVYVKEDDL